MYNIDKLLSFALDGKLYRAFDHVVIAAMGMVVAIPLQQTEGKLCGLIDQSPVPWQELWAVLDVEPECSAMFERDLHTPEIIGRLELTDKVLQVAQLPEYRATVFINPHTGLRLGISTDYIYKAKK